MPEELLRDIHIFQVVICPVDVKKLRVMAEFSDDVREAMPYLAALLPLAGYNHETAILNLVLDGRLVTVYPHVVSLAKARDEEDAHEVFEWLRTQINQAYAHRDELTPCYERKQSPRLFDIYLLLPRDNCGRCGEATCTALANRLMFGTAKIEDCPQLYEEKFELNRQALAERLGVPGH